MSQIPNMTKKEAIRERAVRPDNQATVPSMMIVEASRINSTWRPKRSGA